MATMAIRGAIRPSEAVRFHWLANTVLGILLVGPLVGPVFAALGWPILAWINWPIGYFCSGQQAIPAGRCPFRCRTRKSESNVTRTLPAECA